MAKGKGKRKNGKRNITISAAVVAGLVSYGLQIAHSRAEGVYGMTRAGVLYMTGYDLYSNRFEFQFLNRGLLPVAGGAAIHWLANRFGINRMIARAGIPFIRL